MKKFVQIILSSISFQDSNDCGMRKDSPQEQPKRMASAGSPQAVWKLQKSQVVFC